jgi:type VI secretion system secreted protein VgrG
MTPQPYTQADRLIRISCEGQPADRLLLERFSGTERLSAPFAYGVDLLSETKDIDPKDLIGKHLTIEIHTPKGPVWIDGLIRRFVLRGRRDPFTSYRAEIVPWIWFLSLSRDCRVFQNKSVPDIAVDVFKKLGYSDYRLDLVRKYAVREYCVQYRETALDFVSRLLEEEGIFYYVQHESGKHTLVLSDDSPRAKACNQSTVRAAPQAGRWQAEDVILRAQAETVAHAGKVALTDYDYEAPTADLGAQAKTISKVRGLDRYEVFDYPGGYQKRDKGKSLADQRMEEQESLARLLRGAGNCRSFQAGLSFTLEKHESAAANGKHVLVEVRHEADAGWSTGPDPDAPGPLSEQPGASEYRNEFVAIPADVRFRPLRTTPQPTIAGAQTAVVVGKSGEEIFTDKQGRVKVQFHWDREGKQDEKSSCWVRVSSTWAGKGWGAFQLPRMGQEVVVSFLDGDPDRPLVTGSVYNGEHAAPFTLPGEQTRSGVRTHSSKKGDAKSFNELRFEDLKDKEEIFLHAERDLVIEVENDEKGTVDGARTLTIKGKQKDGTPKVSDSLTLEKGSQLITLDEGDRTLKVKKGDLAVDVAKGDHSLDLGKGSQTVTVFKDQKVTLKTGSQTTDVKAGKVTIKAAQSIELKVGPNSIKVDMSGVTIKGATVKVKGTGMAEVKAPMTTVKGDGVLTLKGGMTMIN